MKTFLRVKTCTRMWISCKCALTREWLTTCGASTRQKVRRTDGHAAASWMRLTHLAERSQPPNHFMDLTVLKRQNHSDGKHISGCQGDGRGEGGTTREQQAGRCWDVACMLTVVVPRIYTCVKILELYTINMTI
jgi:hypothetical protein